MNRLVACVVALTAALATTQAQARDQKALTLSSTMRATSWSGTFENAAIPVPQLCGSTGACHETMVDVALPAGTWSTPGGLLVGVDWSPFDLLYDLDVFVYGPEGGLAAKSETLVYSQSEAAWVPNPVNGRYRVVIVPKTVIGPLAYRAAASIDHGSTFSLRGTDNYLPYSQTMVAPGVTESTAQLLPDLVPTRPTNFHIESAVAASFYVAFDRGIRSPGSCYLLERAGITGLHPGGTSSLGQRPSRCLRWDQGESNFGSGPFELRHYTNEGNAMYQALYSTEGAYTLRPVGEAFFDVAHGHFHYAGFNHEGLYDLAGNLVASGAQKGICTIDLMNGRLGSAGDGPNTYSFPGTCDIDSHRDAHDPRFPNESYFRMGISVGWADIYPWFIPDQYLDITNVPDGRYVLKVAVNPAGAEHPGAAGVLETDYSNNFAEQCIDIKGDSAVACPIN